MHTWYKINYTIYNEKYFSDDQLGQHAGYSAYHYVPLWLFQLRLNLLAKLLRRLIPDVEPAAVKPAMEED